MKQTRAEMMTEYVPATLAVGESLTSGMPESV
jgi:hypothetical protein